MTVKAEAECAIRQSTVKSLKDFESLSREDYAEEKSHGEVTIEKQSESIVNASDSIK